MIKAILFDFIGTTVKEAYNDVINQCFANAFSDHKIHVDSLFFTKNRGLDKRLLLRMY